MFAVVKLIMIIVPCEVVDFLGTTYGNKGKTKPILNTNCIKK